MNKILLTGRITKDIELRHTNSNIQVVQFSIAVNRNFKNQNGVYETDFINCVAYKKTAEMMSEYLKKGDKIAVVGNLQTRTYENNEGKKVYISEVIVENIEFLEFKKGENKEIENKEIVEEKSNSEIIKDVFKEFGTENEEVLENLPF